MEVPAGRSDREGGNAGGLHEGGVHPGVLADRLEVATSHGQVRFREGGPEHVVPVRLERVPMKLDDHLGREAGSHGPDLIEDRLDLADAVGDRLARLSADLDADRAAGWIRRVVAPTSDHAGVVDGRPIERVRGGRPDRTQTLEPADDFSRMTDRVDPDVRSRPVRGPAVDDDVEPAEALVGHDRPPEPERLDDDRRVHPVAPHEIHRPLGRRLFIHREGDDEIAPQPTTGSDERLEDEDLDGGVPLVVGRAEADHPVPGDDWHHRAVGPTRVPDGVDMGIQAE